MKAPANTQSMPAPTLTAEERTNGWTAESLAAYQLERDKVADKVPGNIVTEFKRGKPPMRIEGAGRAYDPFTRSFK
jgi:hypothetical protein